MAFLVDTINNYLNGIVNTAMAGAGGVAGDVASGVGNSINGVGRSVESSIRYYGDGARDYGNFIKDYTGAPGVREATGTNPLGLTNSSSSTGWSKGGGSSISRTIARADAVTKKPTTGVRKGLPPGPAPKAPASKPAQKALPAPKTNGQTNKKTPNLSGPVKTITVGGVTKKMPVYKDGERVGAPSAAPHTGTTAEKKKPKKGGPTKQSIARKERNRNANK